MTAPTEWPPKDVPADATPAWWRRMAALWLRDQQAKARARGRAAHAAKT